MDNTIRLLNNSPVFNKDTFFDTLSKSLGIINKNTLEKYLYKYLKSGEIARVGRNEYCVKGNLKSYEFNYSEVSIHISQILNNSYYDLDFRIAELYQLNTFLNHQIAHNVIYVFVEKELCISVFEQLKNEFPGKVLIKPSISDFFNYRQDDIIIVKNLPTESPKGAKKKWHTDLEKLLVDVFSEDLIKTMFSESEYPAIYEKAFHSYVINESQMFRYARRRKTDNEIKQFIKEETNVKLRLK